MKTLLALLAACLLATPALAEDAPSARELGRRADIAKAGQVLAIGPTIPLMIGGIAALTGMPHFAGSDRPLRASMALPGVFLVSGSTATAIGGALIARSQAPQPLSPAGLVLGATFSAAGSTIASLSIGATHDVLAQSLAIRTVPGLLGTPEDSQRADALHRQAAAFAPLAATGIGCLVAGNILLMADAKLHRVRAKREWEERREDERRSAVSALPYVSSDGGGATFGVAGSF